MKKCPKCKSEVENNFDTCWNCQYEFIDNRDDTNTICPKCNLEFKTYLDYLNHVDNCPQKDSVTDEEEGSRKLDCLRCKLPLKYQGNYRFHEGTRLGALGDLFELFVNRESFDLYCCPKCGKIEFFLPEEE